MAVGDVMVTRRTPKQAEALSERVGPMASSTSGAERPLESAVPVAAGTLTAVAPMARAPEASQRSQRASNHAGAR
jgi:hypothetical protein